jgi:CIC family chloride channel protein
MLAGRKPVGLSWHRAVAGVRSKTGEVRGGDVVARLRRLHRLLAAHDRRLVFEAVLLGVVGALSARLLAAMVQLCERVFLEGLAGYRPPGLPAEGGTLAAVLGPHGPWLLPLVTTLGGLASGLLVFKLAPEAEGHGTDAAVKAYHFFGGRIRARVPPVKLLASALTIGSGGAAGREGPTALMAAGVGSVYARIAGRPEGERRLLVLTGMAAGLSAMFRSPIGAAIFAVEVLYGEIEFEAGALLYTLVGAVVAYAVNGLFVGWRPIFSVSADWLPGARDHAWFAGLGLASGLVATLLVVVFYAVRRFFVSLEAPPWLKPALGGLGLGVLALALPEVLGGGYGWVQLAMDGRLATSVLVVLLFAKILAFSLTITSGGSGGVFAPSLFVGGMLGGAFAQVFHLPLPPFVVVGMAAVFAGAARVPIATLLMVTEMTGGYHLLPPAALAVALSYLVESTLARSLGHGSLYEAQVPHREDSPAHEAEHVRWAVRYLARGRSDRGAGASELPSALLAETGAELKLSEGRALELTLVPKESPAVGAALGSALGRRERILVLALFRDGRFVKPDADLVLRSGDELLVACEPAALGELLERGVLGRA